MFITILATKLYIPPPRPKVVLRPRLLERLNEGFHRKLTLISAPAGFGKTTLVSEWIEDCRSKNADRGLNTSKPILSRNQQSEINNPQFCWLSLDEEDNDPVRFLIYLITALQKIAANIGVGVLAVLQSPRPPPAESILTALLNEITTLTDNFILILEDFHLIDSQPIDQVLTFLLEHLPPQMHLVITTREDPNLPLARLRARDQLTELRAADLRFTPAEAAEFLQQVMSLDVSASDIAALEDRTEGWIAGLQLTALALQGIAVHGRQDAAEFIKSFTGSHRFVMDYLVEEVLRRQPESVQTFLLRTSILDRLCAPLCAAILQGEASDPTGGVDTAGQRTLEYLEQANLFIVPLDHERRWYRYHHLFSDLLRQRLLQQSQNGTGLPTGEMGNLVAELHVRASIWFENNGLEMEAFHHAAAANDVERAERLIEGGEMPLHFRGAGTPVRNWLESLPKTTMDARPSLWVTYASTLLFGGQHTSVEQKLQAAEAALAAAQQDIEPDSRTRDLVGRIASMRATLGVIQHDLDTIVTQSRRALEYLHPANLPVRVATIWTLGYAYHMQGDRSAARQAYTEIIATGNAFGNSIYTIAATINLGQLQEADNQLDMAAGTYRRVLQLSGDPPDPIACVAYLGLAQIDYQWNDLDTAEQHGQQCLQLTRRMESVDTYASCKVFLAGLKLALGDPAGAAALLAEAEAFVRQHNFPHQMPAVAAAQVLTHLRQGNLAAAAHLAETHPIPISQARVCLAQGNPSAALAALDPLCRQSEVKGWPDELLKGLVLQAAAYQAMGEMDRAVQVLGKALVLAEPGGFIRIFIDEGAPMAQLLSEAAARGIMPEYTGRLLAAYNAEGRKSEDGASTPPAQIQMKTAAQAHPEQLIEALSQREVEILQLIAQGLSNQAIGERLFLALSTVKGHNQIIFGKLQVQSRTEAVARARELGLL